MLEDYRTNSERLEILGKYSAVVSHSDWITAEYRRHGINCRQIRFFANREPVSADSETHEAAPTWRLLMMGRMASIKGGSVLLDAIPRIAANLDRPVSLLFVGDGSVREAWERQAASVSKSTGVDIRFAGWLSGPERRAALESANLLLIPSLWPEPYGMIGLEAAQYGVPAVGFALGGIPDWLKDGVNGCLAPGNPPTANGLADAVVRCLTSTDQYFRMRREARAAALAMTIDRHYADLREVFEQVRMKPLKNDARSTACQSEAEHGDVVVPQASRVDL
jgi:glycosyltransferase involved in cell wall biosynthesis